MKANSKKIEWVLTAQTQYRIAKETGVAQSSISEIINGKRRISNLTLEQASKLTEYANELLNEKGYTMTYRSHVARFQGSSLELMDYAEDDLGEFETIDEALEAIEEYDNFDKKTTYAEGTVFPEVTDDFDFNTPLNGVAGLNWNKSDGWHEEK